MNKNARSHSVVEFSISVLPSPEATSSFLFGGSLIFLLSPIRILSHALFFVKQSVIHTNVHHMDTITWL